MNFSAPLLRTSCLFGLCMLVPCRVASGSHPFFISHVKCGTAQTSHRFYRPMERPPLQKVEPNTAHSLRGRVTMIALHVAARTYRTQYSGGHGPGSEIDRVPSRVGADQAPVAQIG